MAKSEELREVLTEFDEQIKEQTNLSEINFESAEGFDVKKEESLDGDILSVALKK